MRPTTGTGPFADFLRANPKGALHHVAYAVEGHLTDAVNHAKACGLSLAGSTAHGPIDTAAGWRILNIDPAGTHGLLTQLGEQ